MSDKEMINALRKENAELRSSINAFQSEFADLHERSIKKFYLAKFDDDLNKLWYKEFGGDKAYVLDAVYILDDGGILVYGFITDTVTFLRYAYIMHLDSEGNLVTTSSILPKDSNFIICNPGHDYFELNNPDGIEATLSIFDQLGRKLLESSIHPDFNQIPTMQLPSGIYTYVLSYNQTLLKSGQWVKI